jgi:Winged helix DNA-binding domain
VSERAGGVSRPSPAAGDLAAAHSRELLAERLGSQGLSGPPARDPVTVAEQLLAVQGQDARGVRLAVRSRSEGLTAADFERALSEDRSLLITWLNRGTLHLVRSEDYPWLSILTMPPLFTACARRLSEEGVSSDAAERGVAAIVRALANEGPLTRAQLAEHVAAAGIRTEGQAMIHLLMLTCLRGHTVRGPVVGAQHAYVLVRDWIGEPPRPPERDRALAELARRYLRGHQPADDRDLARWAGLPLRDARAGLATIASECVQRIDGQVALAGAGPPPELPPPRLLGAFDPVLLGWRSREFLTGAHAVVLMRNGMFLPFALVRGRAVARWKLARGEVQLEPLEELAADERQALETDGEDVRRYLGLG